MNQSDTEALMTYLSDHHTGWTAWVFDTEGPPTLLQPGTNRLDFVPSDPYGVSVRDRIIAESTHFP